jgi:hypothetical protein
MMAHQEIPELDSKGLRQFGLILGGILAIGFGLFFPWLRGLKQMPSLPWVFIGVAVLAWALLAPNSMRGLYRAWMRIAMAIGEMVNRLILAIVYFLVITPTGIVMHLLGKDPMRRRLDKSAASYRVVSKAPNKNHVERPY